MDRYRRIIDSVTEKEQGQRKGYKALLTRKQSHGVIE